MSSASYLVCAAQRSGGTLLCDLPRTGAGIRDDPSPPAAPNHSSLQGLSATASTSSAPSASAPPNGVFGAKLMWSQLGELHTLAGQLPEYAGLGRYGLLERAFRRPGPRPRHPARQGRQAVSLWRALQTRACRRERGLSEGGPGVYRFEGIDHLVRVLEEEDAC